MAVLGIDKVYRFAQFVANKESRGWINPDEINLAAELAQIAVYSRLENFFLANKKIHNDMRPFLKKDVISWGVSQYTMPTDWRQILNLYILSSSVPVKEMTLAEEADMLNSTIVPPTEDYPFYVEGNQVIIVYPATIQVDLAINYIASITSAPTWAFTTVGGRPVYASGSSVDFEFEDNLFLEIASLVLANCGMSIKDEAVTQYGMAFNKTS